jgi:hypothetical protein
VVFFFVVNLVLRRLGRLVAGGSAAAALEVENAVLRHQLRVLRRSVKRPLLTRRDRVLLAAASQAGAAGTVGHVLGVAADVVVVAS